MDLIRMLLIVQKETVGILIFLVLHAVALAAWALDIVFCAKTMHSLHTSSILVERQSKRDHPLACFHFWHEDKQLPLSNRMEFYSAELRGCCVSNHNVFPPWST